jgi:hypothetical protein
MHTNQCQIVARTLLRSTGGQPCNRDANSNSITPHLGYRYFLFSQVQADSSCPFGTTMYSFKNVAARLLHRRISLASARSATSSIVQTVHFSVLSSLQPSHVPSSTALPTPTRVHSFSSLQNFKPIPPESLSSEVAEGILDLTRFYCRFGISGQRFQALAREPDLPLIERWQLMMEIYVTTQIHVIAGLGYDSNAEGLNVYALHLAQCLQKVDPTMQQLFLELRRDTWRDIVGTVFKLDPKDIPVISVVDARALMHKVSSKMVEPDILLNIQNRTATIRHADEEMELIMKHKMLQQILIDEVYLGGSPSFVEEAGFGAGEIGYVKIQCALADHEGDPLMASYASSSMIKILAAAGVDVDNIKGPGIGCTPA